MAKCLPSCPTVSFAKAPSYYVSLSVQLHLKHLKERNVFVQKQAVDQIQGFQLTEINFFAVSFTASRQLTNIHDSQEINLWALL